MSKLTWDNVGERIYETGISKGVLYPVSAAGAYDKGIAWSGLTSVNASPSGAEANKQYADNINYLNLYGAEEFGFTINAFTYPDEFEECDGSAMVNGVQLTMQDRKGFGFCYQTVVGNDTQGNSHGYKLHLIYGAKASPSEREYSTINDSPEPITMSWTCSTTPVPVTGYKPTARIVIDSTNPLVNADKLKALEDILYGTDSVEARMPLPDEVISIMGNGSLSEG